MVIIWLACWMGCGIIGTEPTLGGYCPTKLITWPVTWARKGHVRALAVRALGRWDSSVVPRWGRWVLALTCGQWVDSGR